MNVTLLGTGGPIPDAARAGPSTLVRAPGATILVDCGRGVLMRLAASGVFPGALDGLLVTHLHSDHITDLNDVITTHWIMAPEGTPLRVWGPPGMAAVVDATLAALGPDITYRITHHADLTWRPNVEVVEVEPRQQFGVGSSSVTVGATDHRPVEPSVAFRVECDGRSVVLAGDGVPCSTLDELFQGADVYVQTVLRVDLVKAIPVPRIQDVLDYHSSVEQAAQTATRAGVGTLVLTHYIPALPAGQEDAWHRLAASHFAGRIVLGDDLTTVEV